MSDPTDPPQVCRRDVVLVTGPRSAGVTSMVEELRGRMPGRRFVESCEIDAADAPVAVVFVVSAVAPVTESDCAVAALAAAQTDVVVAVVSKVDDHRDWRAVLAANRERLAGCAERFRHVAWVGAAAAPRLGEPLMDELIGLLRRHLGDPQVKRRNSLRAWESRVCAEISRLRADATGSDRRARVGALRGSREELLRHRGLSSSEGAIAVRNRIQQTRVALTYSARNRCASSRTELLAKVDVLTRRGFGDFEQCVRRRCHDIVVEVDDEIAARTRAVAADLGLVEPPRPVPTRLATIIDPPVKSRRLETQLMTVLGAGFGLGVALVVTRLFLGLAPELAAAGFTAGGVVGLALAVWVVRVRGLLHDRAMLDRWVNEVTAAVRSAVEERVATGVLAAEAALTATCGADGEARRAAAAQRLAEIDAELREHARAAARAETERDRALPPLLRTLEAIRAALSRSEWKPDVGYSSVDDAVTSI